ncbi:glucose-1-phosphate thymidylyltransferase [Methanofollis fontis]|uniref:Bifunctional protein GlmU n=1 Tax=Methanofollis fontis TaxID=2052832 RepID=A0A483CWK4_9EURY|nr:glucose-1-phosphate thymidylyltransferase [Methanofollis fontis]TAJ44046.1 glucose-1-phosphate thymidylyltransferase [Methanofollis fontis]
MKGLILAGGHGVRLRPLTYSQQKQLIPIANKPILFYCIQDLIDAGIHSIGIVVGPNKEQIQHEVNNHGFEADIEFIEQDSPRGLAHAVKIAQPFIGDDRFIMYLGDNILRGGIQGFVDDFRTSPAEASLLLTKLHNPEHYGVALVDEQKKVILKLLEKPKNPPSNLCIVGIYGLSPRIFEASDNIAPSWRGELEITDALHWLILQGHRVTYDLVEGWWKDTGKPEDLIDANRLVLDTLGSMNGNGSSPGTVENSTISGRCKIGRNTVIKDNSVIKGPVIIGDDCIISNAYLGPYTSIGNGSILSNTEIEDSIVMEGSVIRNADRIVESLIGKNVTIERDGRLPGGRRFVIGDNSNVII